MLKNSISVTISLTLLISFFSWEMNMSKWKNVDKDATFCTHLRLFFFVSTLHYRVTFLLGYFYPYTVLGVCIWEEKVCLLLLNAINKNALSKHFSHLRCNLIECDKIVSREVVGINSLFTFKLTSCSFSCYWSHKIIKKLTATVFCAWSLRWYKVEWNSF